MLQNKLLLAAFALMAGAQLFVPAKMVYDQESIVRNGKELKFLTAPVDPNDPFRGKYITLNFDENTFPVDTADDWQRGQTVYVTFINDPAGFAKISGVYKEAPQDNSTYVKSRVEYLGYGDMSSIFIALPFDRFYMDESKAPQAELKYQQARRDTTKKTYALVAVDQGETVLKDVVLDGISINKLLKQAD